MEGGHGRNYYNLYLYIYIFNFFSLRQRESILQHGERGRGREGGREGVEGDREREREREREISLNRLPAQIIAESDTGLNPTTLGS